MSRCPDPRCTFDHEDGVVERLLDRIDRYGYTMQHVLRELASPSWTYTIGLAAFGHPELVVTGLDPEDAARLLADGADDVLDGHDVLPLGPGVAGLRSLFLEVDRELGEQVLAREDDERDGDTTMLGGRLVRLDRVHPAHWGTDRFAMWHAWASLFPARPVQQAVQAVWADTHHRFPDEPGTTPAFRREQPLLRRRCP